MEQAQRDTRVARVDQAALALDQYDVVILRALEHELFSRTGDEVADHRRCATPLCAATRAHADHGNVAAERENVLGRLARLLAVHHRYDALGEIANAGIGGLGCQRPEVAVGDDQEAMLGNRHFLETTAWRRSTPLHGSVGRSTAGLKRPCSP